MTSREASAGLHALSRTAAPRRIPILRVPALLSARRRLCAGCLRTFHIQARSLGYASRLRPAVSRGAPPSGIGYRGHAQVAEKSMWERDFETGLQLTEWLESHHGPIAEYNARVESGRLRDDEHQRGMGQLVFSLLVS